MAEAHPGRVGRRLSAILAADVAGYSRLMGVDEVGTARILREHRAVADMAVLLDHRVGAGEAVHHAGVLQVGAFLQHQPSEVAAQYTRKTNGRGSGLPCIQRGVVDSRTISCPT